MTDTRHDDGGLVLSALDSPEVIEERLTLVGAALDAPVRLGTFTDEELAALDDLTTTPAQPSPWFASLTDDEKQTALTAALRGLTARGVFRAEPVDPADRTYTALVEPTLAAMLTMRRFVPHVVVAERTTAEFVDWAVLYPQRAGVFLAEYVDRRGLHAFEVAGNEHTIGTLAEWVGRFEVARPDLDVTLTRDQITEQPEVLRAVTETLVATTLTRLAPETMQDTSWSALYTGPAGSYAATTAGDSLRYRGVDTDDITTHLLEALG